MNRFARSLPALLLACAAALSPSRALAADLGPGQWVESDYGLCAEDWALKRITARFRHQVLNVPNLPDVEIVEFRDIHENRYLPVREDWPIGRRYCGATAVLSDGHDRSVWYLIEEGQGFASIGDNVEFCVAGFDRWMVYNGRCRVLR